MKSEDESGTDQQTFKQRIEDKENNRQLVLNAVQEVEDVHWSATIVYYMAASILARLLGINFGFFGMVMVYIIVTYVAAPFFANVVLKSQIRRYIDKNHKRLLAQGSGKRLFALYGHQYELTWSTIEGERVNSNTLDSSSE